MTEFHSKTASATPVPRPRTTQTIDDTTFVTLNCCTRELAGKRWPQRTSCTKIDFLHSETKNEMTISRIAM